MADPPSRTRLATCSRPAARSSSACASRVSTRSRTPSRASCRWRHVSAAHADLEAGAETDSAYRVAGRLAARRGQGKMAFLDLVDRSGRIQLQARVDVLGEEPMERLLELDLGDLIGIDGTVFSSGAAS